MATIKCKLHQHKRAVPCLWYCQWVIALQTYYPLVLLYAVWPEVFSNVYFIQTTGRFIIPSELAPVPSLVHKEIT